MNMDEAIAWLSPNSEFIVPFTRYRILVPHFEHGSDSISYFVEFQKPDTLLKSAVKFLKNKKTEIIKNVEDLRFNSVVGTPPSGGLSN
jgi:hypothetical protein